MIRHAARRACATPGLASCSMLARQVHGIGGPECHLELPIPVGVDEGQAVLGHGSLQVRRLPYGRAGLRVDHDEVCLLIYESGRGEHEILAREARSLEIQAGTAL